jgi:membrane complex biogenesis BtpA family protein
MAHIFRSKPDALSDLLGRRRVVIGVVHLPALPGSPSYRGAAMDDLIATALEDARRYARGGVHGLIVENHGDIPFAKPDDLGPETAAVMAVISDRVRREVGLPLGINVLANGAIQALAVAQAGGAGFVRVNQWANAYVANEGILEGPAAAATRYRARLRAEGIRVFADVHVKHGAHAITADRSLAELTRDLEFFDADAVIVTGQRTGDGADLDELAAVRTATRLPLLVGSGVTPDGVGAVLDIADGVIDASALKQDGVWWNPVDEARVRGFVQAVEGARGA